VLVPALLAQDKTAEAERDVDHWLALRPAVRMRRPDSSSELRVCARVPQQPETWTRGRILREFNNLCDDCRKIVRNE